MEISTIWRVLPVPDRLIRDGLKTSARIAAVSEGAEVLFFRLMLTVCPLGRYHAEPALVKQGALPNRPRIRTSDVASRLDELGRAGLIVRWSVPEGAAYLCLPRFNQRLRFEARSPFPAPPHGMVDVPGQELMDFAADPDPPPRPIPEEKRREESVSRERRTHTKDLRHARNCIAELQERWPRHDIEDNLNRAERRVRQQRGPTAVVTMWWFEKHWMSTEPEKGGAEKPAPETAEPDGWKDCVRESGYSWAETAIAMGWSSLPEHWKQKISTEMRMAGAVAPA